MKEVKRVMFLYRETRNILVTEEMGIQTSKTCHENLRWQREEPGNAICPSIKGQRTEEEKDTNFSGERQRVKHLTVNVTRSPLSTDTVLVREKEKRGTN